MCRVPGHIPMCHTGLWNKFIGATVRACTTTTTKCLYPFCRSSLPPIYSFLYLANSQHVYTCGYCRLFLPISIFMGTMLFFLFVFLFACEVTVIHRMFPHASYAGSKDQAISLQLPTGAGACVLSTVCPRLAGSGEGETGGVEKEPLSMEVWSPWRWSSVT